MQITVDEERCCAGGQCVLVAPEVFDQRDDDGIVVLLESHPPEALYPAVREAAQICPGAAIMIAEGAGDE